MFGRSLDRRRSDWSVIAAGMELSGPVSSSGVLEINGYVRGDILHNGRVIVGSTGLCEGRIQSVELTVAGEVRGDAFVRDRLELQAGGRLIGDAVCDRLEIKPGAVFQGMSRMMADAPLAVLRAPVVTAVPEPVLLEPAYMDAVLEEAADADDRPAPPRSLPPGPGVATAAPQTRLLPEPVYTLPADGVQSFFGGYTSRPRF